MADLTHLFAQNRQWAEEITQQDPGFFDKLAQQLRPQYLWTGCSDSRVPANEIVGLLPPARSSSIATSPTWLFTPT